MQFSDSPEEARWRSEVRGFSVGMSDPPVPFEELWVSG